MRGVPSGPCCLQGDCPPTLWRHGGRALDASDPTAAPAEFGHDAAYVRLRWDIIHACGGSLHEVMGQLVNVRFGVSNPRHLGSSVVLAVLLCHTFSMTGLLERFTR